MSDRSRNLQLLKGGKGVERGGIRGVYLITDQNERLPERVSEALRGGVSLLQYRPKGVPLESCIEEALQLKKLCARYGTLFIVNDDPKLAAAVDADGLHLGQGDGSPVEARRQLGSHKIIGVSTHNLEEAQQAERDGADYIGFGAIYPTGSKQISFMPGVAGLAAVRGGVTVPIVAIGGISPANACQVIDAGADAVAVISSVLSAPRPEVAVSELRLLFNRKNRFPRGAVLTVAGSDSGGGAGIQADLKVITLLGSYGASVITALTAQNTKGVSRVHGIPPSFVKEQLEQVLSDLPIDLIKTGMLHTPAIIGMLAEQLAEQRRYYPLVIDPVMVAKGGAHLLEREAVSIFMEQLLPQGYLLTPNIPEAESLLDRRISTVADMESAAKELHRLSGANLLVKGGHLNSSDAVDILFDGEDFHHFSSKRCFTSSTHGTGCSFASAIATLLAQGVPLKEAVGRAKKFIYSAISHASPIGKGHGPINHYLAAKEYEDDPA